VLEELFRSEEYAMTPNVCGWISFDQKLQNHCFLWNTIERALDPQALRYEKEQMKETRKSVKERCFTSVLRLRSRVCGKTHSDAFKSRDMFQTEKSVSGMVKTGGVNQNIEARKDYDLRHI